MTPMRIEHVAWNVAAPAAMGDWYVAHLGMHIVRAVDAPAPVRFIAADDRMAMLRDPWQVPLQLVCRAKPMNSR
jgi:catechol 2,3-dioxygenase-like lactoylglutathione lyase family enzyme